MENWSKYKPEKFEYIGKWIRNWFSNFDYSRIEINDIIYGSVENYYQSHKSIHVEDWLRIARMSPREVKKEGRKLPLREDWENIKASTMMTALRAKFSQEFWKSRLLETGDEVIVEWNNWGDRIWGVDSRDCKGQNLLGKCLMDIRAELRAK